MTAFFISSPTIFIQKVITTGDNNKKQQICVEQWSSPFDPVESPKHYTVLLFIVLYAVPLSLMTPLYVAIARKLYKQNRTLLSSSSKFESEREKNLLLSSKSSMFGRSWLKRLFPMKQMMKKRDVNRRSLLLSSSFSSSSSSSSSFGREKINKFYMKRKMKNKNDVYNKDNGKMVFELSVNGQQQQQQQMSDYQQQNDNINQHTITVLERQNLKQHQETCKSSLDDNKNHNNHNNSNYKNNKTHDKSQQNNCKNNSSSSERMRKQNNARVVNMLLALVITFALCWLPVYLVQFFTFFHPYFSRCHHEMPELVYFVAFFMQYANSAISPYIYFAFNQTYRKAFKKVFLTNK